MLVFVLAVASALIFSFLCSVFEATLLSVGHARVEALDRAGRRAGRILRRFKKDPDVPIAAILILNTVAHTVGASVAGASYADVFSSDSLWFFSTVFTIAVLVFTEIVPKTLGVTYSGALAVPVAHSVEWLVRVLRPVLYVTRMLSSLLRRGSSEVPVTVDDIRLLAALGQSHGVLGSMTAHMIEGATRLRELDVEDVMVPRNHVVYLSGTNTNDENLEYVRKGGFSRYPFTPTGNLDEVNGIVLAKDLLFRVHDSDEPVDLGSLALPPLLVPKTTSLLQILRRFQEERRHLAIVVDEYGGTHGVVTLEDVLEEIVGEIEDETDEVGLDLVLHRDGSITCRGITELRKLFERLGIETETESQTVGGFVAERLGRVPRTGEQVEEGGYRFAVIKASNRRAERIHITRQPLATGSP